MLVSPNRIKFENLNDVVDFVSKGVVPRKKSFDDFIKALNNPSSGENPNPGKCVHISNQITKEQEVMIADILKRFYKNQKKNQIIMAVSAVAVLISAAVLSYKK